MLAVAGCGASARDDGEGSQQRGAVEANAVFTPLHTATVGEVAKVFQTLFTRELRQAFACNPQIAAVNLQNLNDLTSCPPTDYADLRETLRTVLGTMDRTAASQEEVLERALVWANEQLTAASNPRGHVDAARVTQRYLATALRLSKDQNAFLKAKNPTGIQLSELKRLWLEAIAGENAQYGFIYPVVVDREPTLADIEEYFEVSGGETSWGVQAVDDFARASTYNSPRFEALAEMLKRPGIKARHYYGTPNTRTASLYLIDEHNQVYGFWYSLDN